MDAKRIGYMVSYSGKKRLCTLCSTPFIGNGNGKYCLDCKCNLLAERQKKSLKKLESKRK